MAGELWYALAAMRFLTTRFDDRRYSHLVVFSPVDTHRETTTAGPRFAKEAVMVIGSAKIPQYILRDGSNFASPLVFQTSFEIGSTVLYGFSDKHEYDAFISSSELSLMPYPLVSGYLERRLDSNSLQLVVLDADSFHQTPLQAATFHAVLDSLRKKVHTVPVTHRLMIDIAGTSYRVEAISHVEEASHASVTEL